MRSKEPLADDIHAELVGSVFATVLPSAIMTVLYAGVATLAWRASPDPMLRVLVAAGIVAGVARLGWTLRMQRRLRLSGRAIADRPRSEVEAIERRFALFYIVFAAVLGAFAARAVAVLTLAVGLLVAPLIVGYAAGVSTGVGLRPRIFLPSMMLSVVPTIVVTAATPETPSRMLALLLAGLLAGGMRSTLLRHRTTLDAIAMRQLFATLARKDHLTGLPNRLALAERFDRAAGGTAALAVHCIDLDGFKPINDRYGHPTGDAVLKAVATRLIGLLGPQDCAARLGGDEFMIVQAEGAGDEAAVGRLSQRILATLSGTYAVGDLSIAVGACVGLAILRDGERFDAVVARADASLCDAKRARHTPAAPVRDAAVGRWR